MLATEVQRSEGKRGAFRSGASIRPEGERHEPGGLK